MSTINKRTEKTDFRDIYEAWYDRIYKYAYTLLLNREDAEDVTEDTFLAAYEHYERYDPARASIGTYLTRIAHNRAINLMRSAAYSRRTGSAEIPDHAGSYKDPAEHAANADMVLRLYARLKPEERELLNMRYVMQLKDREIGSSLGVSEKTVNKRINRLLVKCRTILNGSEGNA